MKKNMANLASLFFAFCLIVVWCTHLVGGPTFLVFSIFYFLFLIAKLPKNAFSPLTVFYAYYGVSYVLAPAFC